MTDDWRTPTTASDYFGNSKKRSEIDVRRPVVRSITDLAGPGAGATATLLTNWGDELATFDGYFSSVPGASGAPNAEESFTGFVVSDPLLGGAQIVVGLASNIQYTRSFQRAPADPSTVGFSDWVSTTESASIMRLKYGGQPQPANTWVPTPAYKEASRGNRITNPADGLIQVTNDGWYHVGCQAQFSAGVLRALARVIFGTDVDQNPVIQLEAGGDPSTPGLNGSTDVYLDAGTILRLYLYSSETSTTNLIQFTCREI